MPLEGMMMMVVVWWCYKREAKKQNTNDEIYLLLSLPRAFRCTEDGTDDGLGHPDRRE